MSIYQKSVILSVLGLIMAVIVTNVEGADNGIVNEGQNNKIFMVLMAICKCPEAKIPVAKLTGCLVKINAFLKAAVEKSAGKSGNECYNAFEMENDVDSKTELKDPNFVKAVGNCIDQSNLFKDQGFMKCSNSWKKEMEKMKASKQ